jgi:hypothetical protein
MFSLQNRVGRLVEARFSSPLTRADVESAIETTRGLVTAAPGRLVFCSDTRMLHLIPADTVDLLVGMLTRQTPKIERTAFLAPPQSTVRIQLDHILRKANSAERMCFNDPVPLVKWLDDVLNPNERVRLKAFLTV